MAKRESEVTVFADTNLGTHIGMAMSPDITAGDLKRELEREHLHCFPKLGEIRISKLRVKRKSCFYCMSDSLPIKYAFQGFKGTWFIFIEARVWSSFEKLLLSDFEAQQIGGHILNDNDVTDTVNPGSFVTSTNKNNLKRRRKSWIPRFHCFKALILLEVLRVRASHFSKEKKRLKRVNKICFLNHQTKELVDGHLQRKEGISAKSMFGVSPTRQPSERSEEWNPYSHVESPSDTLSESLSVSDIIKKYFSNYDEVTSASETTFGTIGKESSELPKAITDNNCSKK